MKISIKSRGVVLAALSAVTLLFAAAPPAQAQNLIKVKVGDTTSLAQLGS